MFTFLLDVDGVLNANKAGWSRAPRKGLAHAEGISWTMRWEPKAIDKIAELNRRPDLEVIWATTWVGHTDGLERLFGLPALLSAGSRAMSVEDKQQAALNVLADPKAKLIWADDVAVPDSGELYDKLTQDGRSLLIKPHPTRGLRPEDFDKIDAFVLSFDHDNNAQLA
jgi:hypothetical protein